MLNAFGSEQRIFIFEKKYCKSQIFVFIEETQIFQTWVRLPTVKKCSMMVCPGEDEVRRNN
jgi:hypothetical protein